MKIILTVTGPAGWPAMGCPVSAMTWNSCERSPPMAPVSAATARYCRPRRSKMRQ